MLDGLFQQALLAYGDAPEPTLEVLVAQVHDVMPAFLGAPPGRGAGREVAVSRGAVRIP